MWKTASLVKASHLPEAKVKEWAGHPAQDGKAKLHGTDIGNNERLKLSMQASADMQGLDKLINIANNYFLNGMIMHYKSRS